MSSRTYDFIIVGGGAAGCVLANRLSADRSNRVLVLEAGRPDYWWDVYTHMPAAMGLAIASNQRNWKFVSEPEPFMHDRRLAHPRGKLLGGSSSINAMTFVRGHAANFENWAEVTGDKQWNYAHCLPYFKRLEDSLAFGNSEFRGAGGPQTLERSALEHPLFGAFLLALQQAGYQSTLDLNGAQQEGFAAFDRMIRGGRRLSAARAYLHPVTSRRNLDVRCRALVTKILFSGGRAVGVAYRTADGVDHEVRGAEIILSGGAFNSPQLLQLSGVGNTDELTALDIPTVHHLPGVGENLEDHLAVQIQHSCTQPISLVGMKNKLTWPKMAAQWLLGRGPAASNLFEAAAFIRSNADVPFPDVIVGFAAVAMAFDPARQVQGHGYQVHVGTLAARSRGSVKLASADPTVHPKIVLNFLDNERDRTDWVKAVRIARGVMAQPAFQDVNGGEVVPGPEVATDEQIVEWVSRVGQTGQHPASSCRMGHRELDVIDPASMRVHGLEGLRVVDASVFPSVTNTQTYAPTIMVAEKAADMILGNTPLAPQEAAWVRASDDVPLH